MTQSEILDRAIEWVESQTPIRAEDAVLHASNEIHTMQRAGLYPSFFKGMDTINADAANSPLSGGGHGYIGASDQILIDLNLQMRYLLPPDKRRPPIGPQEDIQGFTHWVFDVPKGMK